MQINESLPVRAAAEAPSFPMSPPQNRLTAGPARRRRGRRPSNRPSRAPGLEQLTAREYQVLVQLSNALRYKEIADHLGISQGTLHFFIRNLYAKLGVHSRTEAVMKLPRP